MGERQRPAEEMATTSTAVTTVPPQVEESSERVVITLRPGKHANAPPRKKVVWTEDTVDNENMNKKKSKCCCIYEKPRKFDESDSDESDDECEHCFGHVERRHRGGGQHVHTDAGAAAATQLQETAAPEPSVALTLLDKPPDRPEQTDDPPPDRDVTG